MNPYFPDFPSANPDLLPPPPERPGSEGPYLPDKQMQPPPSRERNYPHRPPPPRPYDEPPRRPYQMKGYGFNGPPRAPPPPPRERAPPYGGPPERYRDSPPPPPRGEYPPKDRWAGHSDRGHAAAVNNRGSAGDLGDLPIDGLKIQQTSNAIPDSLYGRRDSRPKVNTTVTHHDVKEENPVVRSVSWAFHEGVMNREHAFNDQYKDFDTMDEAINQKHKKKKAFKSPSKSVQVKANVRSWKFNRNDMIKKLAKEQYEDFEKSNTQVSQDMASKQYQQQYQGFEAFKTATANQNGNETKKETESTEDQSEKLTNEQFPSNEVPMNPPEATKSDSIEKQASNPSTGSALVKSPMVVNQINYTSPNISTTSNQIHTFSQTQQNPVNNSVPNNKPVETDEYSQYINAIDNSQDDTFSKLPNATSQSQQQTISLNETNLLMSQPIEPSLVSNASYEMSSSNVPTTNATITAIPVNSMFPNFPQNQQNPVNNSNSLVVNNTTNPLLNTSSTISNISSLPQTPSNMTNQTKSADTEVTPKSTLRLEPELSTDTMAMKRTSTSYPDEIIKNLLLLGDRLSEEAKDHTSRTSVEGSERRTQHTLRQLSGPPNFSIQKQISSTPRTGMQRTTVMDLPPHKSKLLELKNLTGMVNSDSDSADEVKPIESVQRVEEIREKSTTSPIAEMVKTGAISLEENDSKDFFRFLVSALKNKTVESLHPITRSQNEHKLKSIPNPYNFVIPETKKFILEEGELNEERLMEILGEHVITTRQKQRQLEQRKRISQIKNQALSKRTPRMGHFSTSQLRNFKLKDVDGDDETTSFLKSLEPIVKMMSQNESSLLIEHADKKNSDADVVRRFIRKSKQMHNKRQNLKNVNQPLYTVQQNMADLIKIWQNTMDDVPGLTEENRKIDESGGTANETIENIKGDQQEIKEKVKENVDKEGEEQKEKTQKVVQDNNPPTGRRDDVGGDGDHVHQVFSKVKAGTERLREKLKHKLYEKMFDSKHMHDDDFDFKGNVPKLPKNQEEIKEGLNQELESVISGQRNISRKLDKVFQKAISQLPRSDDGTKKDLVTDTQDKIEREAKKVSKHVDEVIQKAKQDHLDTLDRVFAPQGNVVEHLNAESLPGMDRRSNITYPKRKKKKQFQFEQKTKKTLQALKNDLHLSWKHGPPRYNKMKTDFKNALAKLFFDDEKKSSDLLQGIFPEPLRSNNTKNTKDTKNHLEHPINGKILGSRARSFKAIILGKLKKEETYTPATRRINKRDNNSHTTIRGLIPSAIGDMSPSSEHPTQPSLEKIKEKEKAVSPGHENSSTQPWDQNALHALMKLQNDYNNLKVKLLQQQQQKMKSKADSSEEKKQEPTEVSKNVGSVGTSPEDEQTPPVGEDGKPHPNSGPQEDYRTDEEKQGEPEKEKENQKEETGESGKDELGSHLVSKVQKEQKPSKGSSKNDNSFEAGLTEGGQNGKQAETQQNVNIKQEENEKVKPEESNSVSQKVDNANTSDKEAPPVQQPAQTPTPEEPAKQNRSVNVTALELGIIKLLNESNPIQHAKTKHGKQMEELNMKYEALKLPIENGEFWPIQMNKGKKKLKGDKTDKENAGSNDSEMNEENLPNVVDATPTESSPTADYLTQRLKLMELSSLLSANNNDNKTASVASQQPVPAELKLDDDLTTTNATPGGPEEMTIQLSSQPTLSSASIASPSLSANKSEEQPEITPQTPAELAKKLVEQLNLNNNNNNAINENTKPFQQDQVKTTANPLTPTTTNTTPEPQVNPLATTLTTTAQPAVVPVPIDSKLGKMLYPNSNDQKTHNTTTSLVIDGNKESINTNIDGTNYSSVLIDQTKQLLQKNMIKRKDLINLLQSAHVLDNLQNVLPSGEQNNNLLEALETQPGSRSTVTKNGETKISPSGEDNIHITLQKKDGQFYLVPNRNEAIQKHLVPQEIGLVPSYQKKS